MMPTYEFRCPECELTYEADTTGPFVCHTNHDEPVEMKRVFSLGGITLKGTGFYKTDKDK